MLHDTPLILRVANKKNFVIPLRVLFLLVVLSAALSPQPVLLILLTLLFFGAEYLAHILGFYKVNIVELTLTLSPDGRVSLESGCKEKDIVAGFLDGQQWCTHQFAVLRMVKGDTVHKLLILSSQQQTTHDFRRLNMWLRQDLFASTKNKKISAI